MPENLPIGAHLVTPRGWYEHHGIHVGNGRVVHYAGYCKGFHAGPVEETSLEGFAAGQGFTVRSHPASPFTPAAIVERARSRIGEQRYGLFANNCEHFCEWAVNGRCQSFQVERLLPATLLRRAARRLAERFARPAIA